MVFRAFEGRARHLKAKERVIRLFESRGFSLEKEVEFKDCETEVGLRDYTADIVANLKVIIEIDGKDHGSKTHIHKDKVRDLYFKSQRIPTVRLQQDGVATKMPDSLIFAEFCYQLFQKEQNRFGC